MSEQPKIAERIAREALAEFGIAEIAGQDERKLNQDHNAKVAILAKTLEVCVAEKIAMIAGATSVRSSEAMAVFRNSFTWSGTKTMGSQTIHYEMVPPSVHASTGYQAALQTAQANKSVPRPLARLDPDQIFLAVRDTIDKKTGQAAARGEINEQALAPTTLLGRLSRVKKAEPVPAG